MRWNAWSYYWLCWIAFGFGIPESLALFTGHPENTLSYQVWHLEGQGATAFRYFTFCFCLWLLIHMVYRKFT